MKKLILFSILFFTSVCYAKTKTIEPIPDKKAYKTTLGENNDEVIIGDEKSAEFIAQMTFTKWNKENSLTLQYSKNDWFDPPVLENDKIKLINHTEELEIFKADKENFKFILTLKEKPLDNEFEFYLKEWEDFNFYFQPELTQEEIKNGFIRPDNVVGSYAVYHKTKLNHEIGKTNYGTGKAFHIYRPKWIDADGMWVWADLKIENGSYKNKPPWDFLNTATYPIYCNDTFGNTNHQSSAGAYQLDEGLISVFALSEDGDVSKLTIWCDGNGSTINAKGLIHDDDASTEPNTLMGATNATSVDAATAEYDFTFSSAVSLTTGDWWLGAVSGGNALNLFYDSSGGNKLRQEKGELSYSSPGAWPHASDDHYNDYIMSVYATYTTGAAAGEGKGYGIIIVH